MRAIIWTVVGLIAVAAVVFFIVVQRQDAKVRNAGLPTAAEIKQDADRIVKRADEYTADLKKLQGTIAGAGKLTEPLKAKVAEAEAKLNQIRDKAKTMATQTAKAAEATKREVTELLQGFGELRREIETAAK